MNFPQKREVNVAVASKRKHDMSHYHVGTTDFGRIKPIECRYLVPGDEVNINLENETRVLNAMPSPTIGRFDVVYRSFFVPLHHIWAPFNDFIKNQTSVIDGVSTDIDEVPYIVYGDFITYITNINHGLVSEVSNPQSETSYDFVRLVGTTNHYYSFTKKGRVLMDFLHSLGINIPLGGFNGNTTQWNTKLYIVLPLVCFWKFYFDWIVPSRFILQHMDYIQLFITKYCNSSNVNEKVLVTDFFTYLCHEPLSYFDDDFFTTATEYPFSNPEEQQDPITISNPEFNPSTRVESPNLYDAQSIGYSGSVVRSDGDNNMIFNMYTLQTLGKLQDLLNRNLIAGTKVQDWLLSEFGIRPNNDALHLSTYLGCKRTTLSVNDVISNADTEAQGGTPLGAYGGYVRNRQRFDFGYKANEHGFYFITYELVPKTNYFQGLHAQFDMKDRFDFFQPEFDNQQGAPIPLRRLIFDSSQVQQNWNFDGVFGFQLQYADQKFANDVLSGDFRTRFGVELRPWFLTRDVSYMLDYADQAYIREEFCLVRTEYQNWHYIFSDMTDELDPFLVAFYFNEPMMRPMKSVVEGFEPTYKQSNKSVSLDFSGSVK